jgi:hypothetical protein
MRFIVNLNPFKRSAIYLATVAYSHASRSLNTIDTDHFSAKMVLSDRLEWYRSIFILPV